MTAPFISVSLGYLSCNMHLIAGKHFSLAAAILIFLHKCGRQQFTCEGEVNKSFLNMKTNPLFLFSAGVRSGVTKDISTWPRTGRTTVE